MNKVSIFDLFDDNGNLKYSIEKTLISFIDKDMGVIEEAFDDLEKMINESSYSSSSDAMGLWFSYKFYKAFGSFFN
jgi:hypothetical protein